MGISLSDISLVDILKTGVTGFAVVLLFLGYRLTTDVQSRILAVKPSEFTTLEMYREWKDMVLNQLMNTRYFMIAALIFFAGGLFQMMYSAESNIIVSFVSIEQGSEPQVTHLGKQLKLEDGSIKVPVKDDHSIIISNDLMVKELFNLRLANQQNRAVARNLVAKEVELSQDAGFGL